MPYNMILQIFYKVRHSAVKSFAACHFGGVMAKAFHHFSKKSFPCFQVIIKGFFWKVSVDFFVDVSGVSGIVSVVF